MYAVKKFLEYFRPKVNRAFQNEALKILSEKEKKIFLEMSEYDKFHCLEVYKKVKRTKLKNSEVYLKLALLHDSGKGKVGLFRRIKRVLIGDKILEKHPEIAFKKLKNINFELAKLCLQHHNKDVDEKMKIFQELDDK